MYRTEDIDPETPYLVVWRDGSKRLLFGQRILDYPVGSGATITRLVRDTHTDGTYVQQEV